jgi:hypothetical protein
MSVASMPLPPAIPSNDPSRNAADLSATDGTRTLLITGGTVLVTGIFAGILTATVLGGIGRHGPHTNAGWLFLLIALACLPFGLMLFTLGAAKWLRNRSLARDFAHDHHRGS